MINFASNDEKEKTKKNTKEEGGIVFSPENVGGIVKISCQTQTIEWDRRWNWRWSGWRACWSQAFHVGGASKADSPASSQSTSEVESESDEWQPANVSNIAYFHRYLSKLPEKNPSNQVIIIIIIIIIIISSSSSSSISLSAN